MKVVEVTNLEKTYRSIHALNGVSFSVEAGEIFGLLGPNGAGKTTAIECLEGLRDFDKGTVRVLGIDPAKEGPDLRKRIGMQLQESALPKDIKVREAMDLYASFYENPIDWEPLIDRIGLTEKRESRFSKLSGGQKQRLYIALALVNDPEVVFFDEITTGLDPQSRRVMWNLVREIRDQGKTVFLTTHFMDEAEVLCDRLVILDEGKIIASGTADELIQNLDLDNRVVFTADETFDSRLVETLSGVTRIEIDDFTYTISGKGDLLIKTVVDHLVDKGIPFRGIRSEYPDLEDVFLTLTGRRIRG